MKNQKRRLTCMLLAVVLTLQMTLLSGIIAFSAETETPITPTDQNVSINGLNLVLNGEIGLTYHVYVPKEYRSGTMELKVKGRKPVTMNITDCPTDDNRRYIATCYISAVQLSEPVTLTVYDKDGKKLDEKSRSVKDYAELLLADNKALESEKNVAKALINYGHYAQIVCSEETGWVIGKDYAETTAYAAPAADPSVFDKYGVKWQVRGDGHYPFSMSLRLDYQTGIYLYFRLDEKPTVSVNGHALNVTESKRLEGSYETYIGGINALNLKNEYDITVNDAAFTLSAFSYCKLAASHDADGDVVNAMLALYEFSQAIAEVTPMGAQ